MTEYIDTSINPADYIEVWEAEDAEHGKQLVMAVDDLKCLPPADVRPVRRGRWIWEQDDWQNRCSVCRKTFDYSETYGVFDFWAAHYCPNCGADMRGGDAE